MKWKIKALMLLVFMLLLACNQSDFPDVEWADTDAGNVGHEDAEVNTDIHEEAKDIKDESINPTFRIVESQITLAYPRQKAQLQVVAIDEDGVGVEQPEIQWKSFPAGIVSVHNGEISALALGNATITGTWNGMEDTVQVFVKKIHELEIRPGGQELLAGESLALKVHYFSADGEELYPPHAVVQWIGNAPEVASMATDGELVAIAGGTVKVQARSEYQVAEETFFVDVRYVDISCAAGHCCMISTLNHLYCWGDSLVSRLVGGASPAHYPKRVESAELFKSVYVSYLGACALDFQGKPWCWGTEEHGRLGTGEVHTMAVDTPKKVDTEFTVVDMMIQSSGTYFLDEEGKLYALGAWPPGNPLDLNLAIDVHLTPTLVDEGPWTGFEDVRIDILCLNKMDSIYCIGNNQRKIFGYGKGAPLYYDGFVPWGKEAGMTSIIGESTSAVCGIDQDGDVWCAGESNSNGIFGYEMEKIEGEPVGPNHYFVTRASWNDRFTKLHRGESFFCGEMNGQLACWGPNNGCQLGWDPGMPAFVGNFGYSYFPIWMKHPPFSKVSLAADSGCLLSEEGHLMCWGLATASYLQPLQFGNTQHPDGCTSQVLPVTAYKRPEL